MTRNRTMDAKSPGGSHHVVITSTTVAFALSRGMTMAAIEGSTGLDGAALGDPDARLPAEIAHRLWQALERAEPDIALGLEAARAAPLSVLAGMVHGARYAATLRDAFGFLIRNRALLADRLELELREGDDEVLLVARHPSDAIDGGRVAEVGSVPITRLLREALRMRTPLRRAETVALPLRPEAKPTGRSSAAMSASARGTRPSTSPAP